MLQAKCFAHCKSDSYEGYTLTGFFLYLKCSTTGRFETREKFESSAKKVVATGLFSVIRLRKFDIYSWKSSRLGEISTSVICIGKEVTSFYCTTITAMLFVNNLLCSLVMIAVTAPFTSAMSSSLSISVGGLLRGRECVSSCFYI